MTVQALNMTVKAARAQKLLDRLGLDPAAGSPPVIIARKTQDLDKDAAGSVKMTFNKNIKDSTVNADHFECSYDAKPSIP
jgi:hypothetical protein